VEQLFFVLLVINWIDGSASHLLAQQSTTYIAEARIVFILAVRHVADFHIA